MALLALFDLSLVGRADRPALEFEDADGGRLAWTFGDLERRSNQVAHALRARGVGAGDRVAFQLANSPAIVLLWLAAAKLGVVLVPINVLYKGREVRHVVADAEPMAVVTTPADAAHLPEGAVAWMADALLDEAAAHPDTRPVVDAAHAPTAASPMALVYTSGTTGASKGAVLTHGTFAANALALVTAWGITEGDRYLAALPLFHVHGLGNGLHVWLASGCHMRLVTRFEHERAPGWFLDYRPTLFFGVPTMYVRLLEVPADQARAIGDALRLCVSGSAPLPAAVLEAFHARYGQVILERYGMTETLMIASNPLVGERRPGTVGVPLPMTAVSIRDDAGAPVPPGTSGELWVRGPHVCDGYWRRPDATAAAFVDGWFRTGDVGVQAPDGYLTLEGRRSDLIIAGGFNIYPREIEELLGAVPGVREAAVVGAPDALRGEVPVAYVVADATVADDALLAAVRAELASFKVPRAVVRVDALPRNAMGKVQRHLLPPWSPPGAP
ncbi:MAG: AMP-binding protein [Gemmatimonadetes bacterium]|nr:AMP-binding protein [Gemmatimonadota bacterium]